MDVFNAFKGIEDDIGQAIDATMPRQAIVTRADSNGGVWVRFTPVDASVPEMWFPSTVSNLPAGTAGWVHPLAGGKGRFIADEIVHPEMYKPLVKRGGTFGTTLSTAGDYPLTSGGSGNISFTGLVPGATYELEWFWKATIWSATNSSLFTGVRITDNAGPTFYFHPIRESTNPGGSPVYQIGITSGYSATVTADSSGEVWICPAVRWQAGSLTVTDTRITARLTRA